MTLARRALLGLLAPALLLVSCVSREGPTGPGGEGLIGLALQPALIPSAADGTALPVNRIRAVVTRTSDDAVLADVRFEVSPSDPTWSLGVPVPVSDGGTEVVVLLYLLNVDGQGVEAVQFSGRSAPLVLTSGAVAPEVDVDLVRGPPSNLLVTGVTIVQAPDTLEVTEVGLLRATVAAPAGVTTEVYWTSLAPAVLEVADTVATGVSAGVAQVVASAGAFADTVSVVVRVPRVATVQISSDSADVQVGATRAYTVVLRSRAGSVLTGRTVVWETLDPLMATVDQAGVVTGVLPGVTRVRATSEGVSDEAVVRVTVATGGGGATIAWTRGSGGVWSDPANWTPARVPEAGDTVQLTQGVDYAVQLDVDATVERLVIGGTSDVISLNVGDRTLTIAGTGTGSELEILPLGAVEINNGTLIVQDIANNGRVRSTGVATISVETVANDADWRVPTGVQLLGAPTGVDFETSGAVVIDLGSSVVVSPSSTLSYLGGTIESTGGGLLTLLQGASLLLYQDLVLGEVYLGLTDAAIVSVEADRVTVGPTSILQLISVNGFAEVNAKVINQGIVYASGPDTYINDSVYVAAGAVLQVSGGDGLSRLGTGGVDNAGSILLGSTDDVYFGPGSASQSITNRNGGLIQTLPGGERFINGQLINEGDVLIAAYTELHRRTAQGVDVTATHVNSGTLELLAQLAEAELDIVLGGSSPTFTNTGTVTVGALTTLSVTNLATPAGAIVNAQTGILNGAGTVSFVPGGAYPDPTGVNHGTIAPGTSPGLLNWLGSVPMGPTGVIAIELEGTTRGSQYDALDASADLVLNLSAGQPTGNLIVTASGFSPYFGDRFAVLTFRGRFGNFASVTLPTNIAGVTFDTIWAEGGSADTLYVEVIDGPPRVLQPAELCSDYSPASIATFADANLDAAVRAALGLTTTDDMSCQILGGLTTLAAGSAGITSLLGIQNATGLVTLSVFFNSVTDVSPLAGLTDLQDLNLNNNPGVGDITALGGLSGLRTLVVRTNGLTDVSVLASLTALTSLNIANNSISDLGPLSGLTNLTFLAVGLNNVTDISPLSGLTNLTGTLWLDDNAITNLDALSNLTGLTGLNAWNNAITNIDGLAGLTALTNLSIYGNQITDIGALEMLTALTNIRLDSNPNLSNIQPLLDNSGIGSPDQVNLTSTAVSCSDVTALRATLATVVAPLCP